MTNKKYIKNIALSCLFLICFLSFLFVNSKGYTTKTAYTDITTTHVNIREGAGTNYTVLGQLTNNVQITIYDETKVGGYIWYKIAFNGGYGYIRSDCVKNVTEAEEIKPISIVTDEDFENFLSSQGFPEDYKSSLRVLHTLHPAWIFKNENTNLDFDYAVTNEITPVGKSLISASSVSSWKSTENGAYNWSTGQWYGLDGSSWVAASRDIVAYYMDPRNFLDEVSVFQFLDQSFDASVQTLDGVKSVISGSFMENDVTDSDGTTLCYANAIFTASQTYGANPYVMAAMIIQEQGRDGTSSLISGTDGVYNYYNIGAYTSGGMSASERGIWYAKGGNNNSTTYQRPWNTRLKSISGGIEYYADGYIQNGQSTLYLKRFNVIGNFTHQYMTNTQGAYSEGRILSNGYTGSLREMPLTFYIPTYNNMPSTPCPKPTKDGSPNNKLSSLSVSGYSITPDFNSDTNEYMLVVSNSVPSVYVSASVMDSSASVSGAGTVYLHEGNNTVTVSVTAENGDIRNYVITIAKKGGTGDEIAFNNVFSISGSVVYNILPGKTVSDIKNGLLSSGGVSIGDKNGNVRGDGEVLATGDTVCLWLPKSGAYHSSLSVSVLGDIDGDGRVSTGDLIKVRNKIIGTHSLSDVQSFSGDVNGDGSVTTGDLIKIRNHILGTKLLGG